MPIKFCKFCQTAPGDDEAACDSVEASKTCVWNSSNLYHCDPGYEQCETFSREAKQAQAELDRLRKLLALRDRQIADIRKNWLDAAEMALMGNDKGLLLMVGLARETGKLVQSQQAAS